MTRTGLSRLCLASALMLAAGGLAGCNENERDRALQFEKGSYQGPADTPLSDEQRNALRARTGSQSF